MPQRLIDALDVPGEEIRSHSLDNSCLNLILIEQVQARRNHVAASKTRRSL